MPAKKGGAGEETGASMHLAIDESEELLQVCYSIDSPETYARETTALRKASEDLKCEKLRILTFNEQKRIEIGGKTIEVMPAWKWMLNDLRDGANTA